MSRCCIALLLSIVCFAQIILAQGPEGLPPATTEIFRTYSDRVVQVRILEKESGVKSSIGSGFHVDTSGHIITNYHVISKLVFEADDYQLDVVRSGEDILPATLIHFDVIHDLAVIKIDAPVSHFFSLQPLESAKGDSLYSLGNPHDLGLSIVEGTYNGLTENSLHQRIHFTGSLNPGMSGGPALTPAGEVAGVNVSGYGEQVSFLVPVKFVIALFEEAVAANDTLEKSFIRRVRDQMLANQEEYMQEIMSQSLPTISLASYQVPTQLLPKLKCWSTSRDKKSEKYRSLTHRCSTGDYLFVTNRLYSQQLQLNSSVITSDSLNRFQIYSILEKWLNYNPVRDSRDSDDVTNFKCRRSHVKLETTTQRLVFCARAYKKLEGLYDVALIGASTDLNHEGLVISSSASGISFENGIAFAQHLLEHIAWKK